MGWPGPVTHRQFLVWQIWEDAQWNEMTKEDYYLAQIAAVIHRANSTRRGKSVKITDYKVSFGKPTKKIPTSDSVAASKARWFARVGGKEKVKFQTVEPPEGLPSSREGRRLMDPEETTDGI